MSPPRPAWTDLVRTRATLVWVGLVLATVLSWGIGRHHGGHSEIGLVVLAVAVIKLRFIGRWFMQLRDAPRWLRRVLDGYSVLLLGLLAGLFLAG